MIRYSNDILGGNKIVEFVVRTNKRNYRKFGNRKGIKAFRLIPCYMEEVEE